MTEAAGERRLVSVLVCDVAGSTAIAEALGPERSKLLFDEVVRLLAEEVRRFEGTVAQLTGDGLYALFGAPLAHEDDPERAVRAALSIQEALSAYAREVEEAYGVELHARVAVNTGPVVIPASDAPPEVVYNALGDTVNVAARLQEAAGPDGVCVGPETARLVGTRFALESFGALPLKGKAEPVEAFRVTGVALERVPTPATPLVGREKELGVLCDVLDGLIESRGAIVSVVGEPGIGKTRLASEARARYEGRVRFLEAHCLSYATGVPYAPVRELLRSWLSLGLTDPEARVRLELKAGLASLLGGLSADEAYPFLGGLLGLSLEPEAERRLREYAPDSVKRQTHEALVDVVRGLARDGPVCIVFEDIHWADEPTLELLEELFPVADEADVCLVLLRRLEPDHASWDLCEGARRRYRHRYLELELEPLPAAECASLARGVAHAALPAELVAALTERSGGNPFFLEEAVRNVLEAGAEATASEIPTVVQEALQARLDRLPAGTREVVSLASVVGRTFTLPLLERLAPRERVLPALSELQQLDLVAEERRRPAPEYRFRHGLVQEAAYGSLTSAGKRALHRKVADALEELTAEEPERAFAALARHYAAADEPRKAAEYLLRAGDAARSVYADEEAIAHYRRALPFLAELGDTGRAREALFKVALSHHLAFDFERANAAYGEAFALPEPAPVRMEPVAHVDARVSRSSERAVPGYASSAFGFWMADHMYRGLFALDREVNVLPELADGFEISPDGTRYRVAIREDARWSDGHPVVADDFASAWRRMRDEQVATAFYLADVIEADAVSERVLDVRLREARNYFPYLLAGTPTSPWPSHVVERQGHDWQHEYPLVGNGPFVLVARDESRALLRASETWNGPRGNIHEIELHFGDPSEKAAEWRQGRHDILLYPDPELAKADETVAETVALLSTHSAGFNADVAPFSDARVRRAFSHAVDRERPLVDRDSGIPAGRGGFIPPSMPGHAHRAGPPLDVALARRLLREAGYPDGEGLPELVLTVVKSYYEDDARRVAGEWQQLGARVRVEPARLADMVDLAPRCHVTVCGWQADFPDPEGMLGSMLESWVTLYRDAEIDRTLAAARSARSRDERLRLYQETERLWLTDAAAIVPLFYSIEGHVRRPWIDGFWVSQHRIGTLDEVVVRR
jgi:ABC-type transport system substrate-binding protein/class 3 adenylate cyclase